MAKMLDALARAQRERSQFHEAGPAVVTVEAESQTAGEQRVAQPAPRPAAPAENTGEHPEIHSRISDLIVPSHDHASPIAEQMRQIRTNLETVLAAYPSRAITVSSPVSGDGKTLVTANLAWVLTDNPEQNVLLIDADMRKPEQDRLYGTRRTPGLSEYLRGKCALEEAIHPTSLPNLSVMPGGRSPGKPTGLLSTHVLPAMIEELKRRYTWVVFDTPPLLPVTDAALITRHCVGLLLVVRMGQTHRKVIQRAQELLAEMRLPVLGSVLNEFDSSKTTDTYYSRYYAHGYYGEKRK